MAVKNSNTAHVDAHLDYTGLDQGPHHLSNGAVFKPDPDADCMVRPLINADTGEQVLPAHLQYCTLTVFGTTYLVGEKHDQIHMYTLKGEPVDVTPPTAEFVGLMSMEIGGQQYGMLRLATGEKCLIDGETGEFLTDFYEYMEAGDHLFMFSNTPLSSGYKTYRTGVGSVEMIEEDLEDEEPIKPPEVTEDIQEICDEYVEGTDGFTLELENKIESALSNSIRTFA